MRTTAGLGRGHSFRSANPVIFVVHAKHYSLVGGSRKVSLAEDDRGASAHTSDAAARLSAFRHCFLAGSVLWIQAGRLSMTIAAITPGYTRDRNMATNTDDARFFVDRVKEVAERLDALAKKATDAGVEMLDGLLRLFELRQRRNHWLFWNFATLA
jgi:hypothetical protein